MANLPVCLPGLQGFPVQITGWSSFQETESLKTPNTLVFQLAPTGFWNTQNTFFVNGTQFRFTDISIVQPKQEGLLDISIQPFAELHLWGTSTVSGEAPKLAVLVIPCFQRSETDDVGTRFMNTLFGNNPLSQGIPQGQGVRLVQYVTCVETERSTVSITVVYWTKGMGFSQKDRGSVFRAGVIQPFGIPQRVLNTVGTGRAVSTFTTLPDVRGSKDSRTYSVDQSMSIPYASQATLSVTTPEFKQGFRIIENFTIKTPKKGIQTPFERQLDNYQCLRIDRQTDIKDGLLMIDPRTGKKLSEIDAEAKASQESEPPEAEIDTGEGFKIVAIILGTIIGILVLAALMFIIIGILKGKAAAGAAAGAAAAGATEAVAGTGAAVGAAGATT